MLGNVGGGRRGAEWERADRTRLARRLGRRPVMGPAGVVTPAPSIRELVESVAVHARRVPRHHPGRATPSGSPRSAAGGLVGIIRRVTPSSSSPIARRASPDRLRGLGGLTRSGRSVLGPLSVLLVVGIWILRRVAESQLDNEKQG